MAKPCAIRREVLGVRVSAANGLTALLEFISLASVAVAVEVASPPMLEYLAPDPCLEMGAAVKVARAAE